MSWREFNRRLRLVAIAMGTNRASVLRAIGISGADPYRDKVNGGTPDGVLARAAVVAGLTWTEFTGDGAAFAQALQRRYGLT
jgi:hypothetical protein